MHGMILPRAAAPDKVKLYRAARLPAARLHWTLEQAIHCEQHHTIETLEAPERHLETFVVLHCTYITCHD